MNTDIQFNQNSCSQNFSVREQQEAEKNFVHRIGRQALFDNSNKTINISLKSRSIFKYFLNGKYHQKASEIHKIGSVFKKNHTQHSQNQMLRSYTRQMTRSKTLFKALEIFTEMSKKGIQPDRIIFNILLKFCVNDVEEGLEILHEMADRNIWADVVTYNSLIRCCGKNFNLAWEFFNKMKRHQIEPNVITFTSLIKSSGQNEAMRAWGIYQMMKEKNIQPDKFMFNTLMHVCKNNSTVMQKIHKEMIQREILFKAQSKDNKAQNKKIESKNSTTSNQSESINQNDENQKRVRGFRFNILPKLALLHK